MMIAKLDGGLYALDSLSVDAAFRLGPSSTGLEAR